MRQQNALRREDLGSPDDEVAFLTDALGLQTTAAVEAMG